MKVIIEDDDVKEIYAALHDHFGLDLTKEQILGLVENDKVFLGDYIANGMDTCVRDSLGSKLARKFTGRRWPERGEGEAVYR